MKRIDFLKTLAVISALPLLRVVNAQSNYDTAIKKCAYMINMSNKMPEIGHVGITIYYRNIREMDVEFIRRYLKPVRRMSQYVDYEPGKPTLITAINITFKTKTDLKNFLAEVYTHLNKFNKKDYIKKYL
jgi:hypothetical protein